VIDNIESVRIEIDFLVIVWPGSAGDKVAPFLEGLTVVFAPVETTFAVWQFDARVDDVVLLRLYAQCDLTFVSAR
jgi:hypothetical protein